MKALGHDFKKIRSELPENRSEEIRLSPLRPRRKSTQEEKWKPEAQSQQPQRMEAIANLAAGIAHQFNNALVGIAGNIELLKMDLPKDENIDKYIEPMEASVRRMAHLTNQLLAYARGGKYQPENLSLSDFVEESLPLIQERIDPGIRVETDLAGDIFSVEGDPTQMQMVLSAVVVNASEAIEGAGCISIMTQNKWVDDEFGKLHLGLKPGPYVCLIVQDDGKGMDERTKSKVFEPFFTTKLQGRGLGMAAVHGIVKNHDGGISVDSELGKGTVIRIYLPASEVKVEGADDGEIEVEEGPEDILVVEDEGVAMGG